MQGEGSDEMRFIGAEEYQGSKDENISFKDIVMKALMRIGTNANVEFRGGYTIQKVIPLHGGNNKITEEYVQDTREVYSNSVEYLHDILFPHFDEKMVEDSKNYQKEIQEKLDIYLKDGVFDDDEKIAFRQDRLRICRRLFQALSCFLKRKDYLKGRVFEDEVD